MRRNLTLCGNRLTLQEGPKLLILRCGENDIGQQPAAVLMASIKQNVGRIADLFPGSVIVWEGKRITWPWKGLTHSQMTKI